MPIEATPLFRSDVVRPQVAGFDLPAHAEEGRERLRRWVELLDSPIGLKGKETELLPDFLTDLFQRVLGYRGPAEGEGGRFTISREKLVEFSGKFADAVLGSFDGEHEAFVVAVEGKGPTNPLDRPHGGRAMSAVDQGYRYAINLPCDWIIVTNLKEIRLYYKSETQRSFELFDLRALATDDYAFRRFVFLLGAERVIPRDGRSHLYEILEASQRAGDRLTQEFYRAYSEIRHDLLNALLNANSDIAPADVLGAAQRLLDRTLFIAFAEDRSLLPPDTLAQAFEHRDPYNPRPTWDNFCGLFRAIDEGNESLGIPRYNGGLFAEHELLDVDLEVPDSACELLKRLGDYNYGEAEGDEGQLVDVEILGHIFEQSIEDLEAIRAEIEGGESTRATSKRKREGAFYTPRYITEYIVTQTLQPVITERFDDLQERHESVASGTSVAVLSDPLVYNLEKLNNPQRDALIAFWEAWIEELQTIRVLDPACGSGAFLVEVFDQLHREYEQAVASLTELRRGGFVGSLLDPDRTILQKNIYGVDLNEEAIEIARLSIWIKTAHRGKILTDLDHNIRVGDSIVSDLGVNASAFGWWESLPEVEAQGGFDVVIGNPPYVRSEMLTDLKPYLEKCYETYHGSADLYVYFYEVGVRLLRPGGRLSYIVTNKWLKAGYAEPLRQFFATKSWIEEVIDLGHAKEVFPDADVFPSIIRVRKPIAKVFPKDVSVCVIPRDDVDTGGLSQQVRSRSFSIPQDTLDPNGWMLEPPEVSTLMAHIRDSGCPLAEYAGTGPKRGIMTGFNEAFLISTVDRDRIVASDPRCADLIRPYLRGQDVARWHVEWRDLWMIVLRSSTNASWPWSGKSADSAEEVFAQSYRGVYDHMKPLEDRLRNRRDKGQYWWELRTCSHYAIFSDPKIVYQEIQYSPSFALDESGHFANNKVFMLPTADAYLLGVLNSPLVWWFNWRFLPHMKDEALSPTAVKMSDLSVAEPPTDIAEQVVSRVESLTEIGTRRVEATRTLHDWLWVEFGIEKPGQKLSNPYGIDSATFVAEVKKRRQGTSTVSAAELRRLRAEFESVVVGLQTDELDGLRMEREISDLVNKAYGLTPEQIDLLWKTAPPRMPKVGRPVASSTLDVG